MCILKSSNSRNFVNVHQKLLYYECIEVSKCFSYWNILWWYVDSFVIDFVGSYDIASSAANLLFKCASL